MIILIRAEWEEVGGGWGGEDESSFSPQDGMNFCCSRKVTKPLVYFLFEKYSWVLKTTVRLCYRPESHKSEWTNSASLPYAETCLCGISDKFSNLYGVRMRRACRREKSELSTYRNVSVALEHQIDYLILLLRLPQGSWGFTGQTIILRSVQ